jgi:signal transduction histidine kinase
LVDNMLDISKLTSGAFELKIEKVNLCSVLYDVVQVLRSTLNDAGNVCTIQCPESIIGKWDRTRIEQIFTNLLSNCAKYAPGTPVEISAVEHNGTVSVHVKDGGKGIPKEKQHKIFNPFERLNANEATGLGLGLYIIKQIAEAHRGTVKVESELGAGTAFIVCLPLTPTDGHC